MDAVDGTTVYKEIHGVNMTIKAAVKKTGGRTDRDIVIDVDLNRDDFGDDLDCAAASRAIIENPAYKELVETMRFPSLFKEFEEKLDTVWQAVKEKEREDDAAELDAAMTAQELQMMELCPDGNYDEYTAFLEQGDMVYFFIEPGFYIRMCIPPS
jgi:hypothetical protein